MCLEGGVRRKLYCLVIVLLKSTTGRDDGSMNI